MTIFRRVTIVGLGLIGGSLGMAIKRRRLAGRVVGVSRHAQTLRTARRRRVIDGGTTDLETGVRDAELVVLATPVDTIAPLAERAARAIQAGAILTDVGSTKAALVRRLERSLPGHVRFVGAHPIAGSEQRGVESANAALFDGTLCVLTVTSRTDRSAVQRIGRFWRALGVKVLTMSPQAHDQALAVTSHLPHVVANCLAQTAHARSLPQPPRSLLEMTRIAASDPELWDDIFLSNRHELLAAMRRFERHWARLRDSITRNDRAALLAMLQAAKRRRDGFEPR